MKIGQHRFVIISQGPARLLQEALARPIWVVVMRKAFLEEMPTDGQPQQDQHDHGGGGVLEAFADQVAPPAPVESGRWRIRVMGRLGSPADAGEGGATGPTTL